MKPDHAAISAGKRPCIASRQIFFVSCQAPRIFRPAFQSRTIRRSQLYAARPKINEPKFSDDLLSQNCAQLLHRPVAKFGRQYTLPAG
jgi:hypothetical protein